MSNAINTRPGSLRMMFEAVVAGFCAGSSGVALRLALADETAQTSKFLLLVLFAALTASTWFFHVHAVRVAHGASGGHQRGVGLRLLGRLLHRAEKLHVLIQEQPQEEKEEKKT
ncbi:hypothetical protein AAVH_18033 [Aphelenchoides avenae]|nr:hypothetical protein AAVH_18033 [Aphelenchus avenae]